MALSGANNDKLNLKVMSPKVTPSPIFRPFQVKLDDRPFIE